MTKLLVFLGVGSLLVFSLRKLPLPLLFPGLFREGKFLEQLFGCDFCLGFWVYLVLSFFFRMNFLYEYFYIIIISEVLTAIMASFIMQLVSVGWKDLYSVVYLE